MHCNALQPKSSAQAFYVSAINVEPNLTSCSQMATSLCMFAVVMHYRLKDLLSNLLVWKYTAFIFLPDYALSIYSAIYTIKMLVFLTCITIYGCKNKQLSKMRSLDTAYNKIHQLKLT